MARKKRSKKKKKLIDWKSWKTWLVIGLVLFVLFILFFQIGIKVNFLANNELYIEIDPLQRSIELNRDEPLILDYTLENQNFWFCHSRCELTLYDPEKQSEIYKEEVILNSNSRITRQYEVELDKNGEGQNIYYLDVTCNNIKSLLCQTDENKISRSAFTAVNYKLSREESLLSVELKRELNSFSEKIDSAFNLLKENRFIINNIEQEVIVDVDEEELMLEELNKSLVIFHEMWVDKDYYGLNNVVLEHDIDDITLDLENKKKELLIDIKSYNLHVDIFGDFDLFWLEFEDAYQFYEDNQHIKDLAEKIEARVVVFNNSAIDDFSRFTPQLLILNESFFDILSKHRVDSEAFEELTEELIKNHSITQSSLNFSAVSGTECQKLTKLLSNYDSVVDNKIDTTLLKKVKEQNCRVINQSLEKPDFGELNLIEIPDCAHSQMIDVVFVDNLPKCCIFGTCSDCTLDAEQYPVILIHGHSPLENSRVEESLMSFANMQKRMLREDEFVSIGDININTIPSFERWSRMDYPATFVASYYYTLYFDTGFYSASVHKSESIENYAIRLKELVNMVKENTGASKVNIVAHSMGGLVAREYVFLFGEQDVDKMILVGTPNNGISGRSRQFCSTIGSDKECEDMYKESVFMKRLNNPSNYPKEIETHVFYGVGCDVSGQDGDGVVAVEDALLSYAENHKVEGSCEDLLGVSMHSELIDPNKYPEIYDEIIRILKN